MRAGVFVTGTDTGIGKTFVAACLVRHWTADYWKPAQTGLATEIADSLTVARLAAAAPARIHAPRFNLQAPLAPEAAARAEGVTIALGMFDLPAGTAPLVVEGAGGVLVPLGGRATMADLMARLGLPALLVARTALGTINHTLLSLEALRSRGVAVGGVVMVGDGGHDNAASIAQHGGARVLAILPTLPAVTPEAVAAAAAALPTWPAFCALAGLAP